MCLFLQQTGAACLPSVSRCREGPPLKSPSQTWPTRSPWPPRCTAGERPWCRALQRFRKTLEGNQRGEARRGKLWENIKWKQFHSERDAESDDQWTCDSSGEQLTLSFGASYNLCKSRRRWGTLDDNPALWNISTHPTDNISTELLVLQEHFYPIFIRINNEYQKHL